MAVNRRLVNVFSAIANADLSSSIYRIVYETSTASTVALATDATVMPVGVLVNKPTSGAAASVAGLGDIVKCEAGAAITAGAYVQAVAGGRGSTVAAGTNAWYAGIAQSGASGSGVYFELQIAPGRGAQ
jgi:hypothetical protein